MVELALTIVPCLAVAAALGFGLAWLLRGTRLSELNERNEELETDLGARERELDHARRELGVSQTRVAALEAERNTPLAPGAAPNPAPPGHAEAPPRQYSERPRGATDDLSAIEAKSDPGRPSALRSSASSRSMS